MGACNTRTQKVHPVLCESQFEALLILYTRLKEIFKKYLKIQNTEIPSFFCHLLLEGYSVYHWESFLQLFIVGAQSYWSAKMDQNGKIWPL